MNSENTKLRVVSRVAVIALLAGLTGIAPEFNSSAQASSNSYAGVTGLASRFNASDLNPVNDTWLDSANSGNTLSATNSQISSNLQKITSDNTAGTKGSTASFTAVAGTTLDFVNFPTRFGPTNAQPEPGNYESYSIFYVARYSNSTDSSKRKRILTSTEPYLNVAAGFHDNSVGKMFYIDEWLDLNRPCYEGEVYICQASTSPTLVSGVVDVNDWVLIGFRFNGVSLDANFRTNGVLTGFNDTNYSGYIFELGINSGDFASESSDFEIADYLVFDHALSDSDVNAVETALAGTYGLLLNGQPVTTPTPTQSASATPTPTASAPNFSSQPAPNTQIDSRGLQSIGAFASFVKKGKTLTLPINSNQGIPINYSTTPGCALSKKYKTVTMKIGKKKKKVKVHTAWLLKGTKRKAICQIDLVVNETSSYQSLREKRSVTVR